MQGVGNQTAATLRLLSDLKAMRTSPPDGVSASPIGDDLYRWEASICGPEDSPHEGGIYSLSLSFSDRYPEKPPRVRFTCEMFHPNVFSGGELCLDLLQERWTPCNSVSTVLTSIQSLLTDPNTASPANPEAAALYDKDRQSYNRRVRRCAQKSVDS